MRNSQELSAEIKLICRPQASVCKYPATVDKMSDCCCPFSSPLVFSQFPFRICTCESKEDGNYRARICTFQELKTKCKKGLRVKIFHVTFNEYRIYESLPFCVKLIFEIFQMHKWIVINKNTQSVHLCLRFSPKGNLKNKQIKKLEQ